MSRSEEAVAAALPAWPVLAMVWGLPLWWVLGITVIPLAAAMALVMAGLLALRRDVVVVPGVGLLAAFVGWVCASAVMLDAAPRALGFTYRLIIVLFVAVAFVYTINAAALTRRAVVTGLTAVWIYVIAGGLAALQWPTTRLSTVVGRLLPEPMTRNSYVFDLFFPPLAEVQHPDGAPVAFVRPSAPFPYANSWGAAVALLTPVAVACWLQARSWGTRIALLVAGAALVAPAVASSNRGMFAALGVAAGYVLLRCTARNRAAPVLAGGAVSAGAAVAVAGHGAFEQMAERQQYGQSTAARAMLYRETLRRAVDAPLLGHGAPRPSTVQDLSVGTQGYVWTVLFSHGFVGLALIVAFFVTTLWRTRRTVDDVDVVLHAVLVVTVVVMVFYGLDLIQMLTVVLVAAVLLRRRYGLDPP